jgi:hypothetical protein
LLKNLSTYIKIDYVLIYNETMATNQRLTVKQSLSSFDDYVDNSTYNEHTDDWGNCHDSVHNQDDSEQDWDDDSTYDEHADDCGSCHDSEQDWDEDSTYDEHADDCGNCHDSVHNQDDHDSDQNDSYCTRDRHPLRDEKRIERSYFKNVPLRSQPARSYFKNVPLRSQPARSYFKNVPLRSQPARSYFKNVPLRSNYYE